MSLNVSFFLFFFNLWVVLHFAMTLTDGDVSECYSDISAVSNYVSHIHKPWQEEEWYLDQWAAAGSDSGL